MLFLTNFRILIIFIILFPYSVNRTSPHSYSVHNSFQNCSKYQHDLDTKLPYTIIIRCSNAKEDATFIHLKSKSDNNITYNNFFIIMPSSLLITWHPPFYRVFIFQYFQVHKRPYRKIAFLSIRSLFFTANL